MKYKPVREKKHRLDVDFYKGGIVVTFTICIKDRKPFFINNDTVKRFQKILLGELKEYNCSAFVYLFMPDHAHLTLTGDNEKSEI